MANKNNNLVYEMIDEVESDDAIKDALKKIFQSEINHSDAPSATKYKITHCREIIEKMVR